jgi:hypothetical protein
MSILLVLLHSQTISSAPVTRPLPLPQPTRAVTDTLCGGSRHRPGAPRYRTLHMPDARPCLRSSPPMNAYNSPAHDLSRTQKRRSAHMTGTWHVTASALLLFSLPRPAPTATTQIRCVPARGCQRPSQCHTRAAAPSCAGWQRRAGAHRVSARLLSRCRVALASRTCAPLRQVRPFAMHTIVRALPSGHINCVPAHR